MQRYKITFTTGEKFTLICIDGFSPQQAVTDWNNPSLPPENIAEITELHTDEEFITAQQSINEIV